MARSRSGTARSPARASEEALRAVQLERLRAGTAHVLRSNPFWRERLTEIKGWDDFERLPMTTEQRIRNLRDVGATVLLATPTYALRIAERARELGLDLASSDIRLTIHAGEPGASIPQTRAAIEAAYMASSIDHTGMTELGPTGHSCSQRDGVHLIESEFIFEVLDEHGRPADEGELVATNLGRWGSPLIRYRTGDRVQLTREECSCGSPFVKLVHGIRGRVDGMFTGRGVNLFPSQA